MKVVWNMGSQTVQHMYVCVEYSIARARAHTHTHTHTHTHRCTHMNTILCTHNINHKVHILFV